MSGEGHQKRRRARELALQALYAIDVSGEPAEPAMEAVFTQEHAGAEEARYARLLVNGTLAELPEIDRLLEARSESWSLRRMAAVDRNLLRLAAYELLHQAEVPRKVALNEAVEIAKRFGDVQSPAFINAILDKIQRAAPSAPEAGPDGTAAGASQGEAEAGEAQAPAEPASGAEA